MRKLLICCALVIVFAGGMLLGMSTPTAEAGPCYWKCGCNGVPMKCCTTPFGTSCKPDKNAPIQCPQEADC